MSRLEGDGSVTSKRGKREYLEHLHLMRGAFKNPRWEEVRVLEVQPLRDLIKVIVALRFTWTPSSASNVQDHPALATMYFSTEDRKLVDATFGPR